MKGNMPLIKQGFSRSLFILPALILLAIFIIYPVLSTMQLSFTTAEGEFTLDNFRDVLGSRRMINPRGFARGFGFGALPHNFIWILIHLPLTTTLGLVLAVTLRNVKGATLIKSSIFLGMVIPMVIAAIIFPFMFDRDAGIVNVVVDFFGIAPRSWLVHPDTVLLTLIFASVWLWTGFSMILYSAGIGTIPKEYYDAASVDGASPMRTFFSITIPLLKPVTIVVVAMTILWNLRVFDIVFVATGGGPGGASNVLSLQMFLYAFRLFDFHLAAVVAVILMLLMLPAAAPMIISSIRGEKR